MTKDFKSDLLPIKNKNYVQDFMPQINLYAKGNDQDWDRGMETTKTVKAQPHNHQLHP